LFDIGTSGTVANANAHGPIETSDFQPQGDGLSLATSISFRSSEVFTGSASTYDQTPLFALSQNSRLEQSGNGFSQSENTLNGLEMISQPVNLELSDPSSYVQNNTVTSDSHYALGSQGIGGQDEGRKYCNMAETVDFDYNWDWPWLKAFPI
jgi:hypothetical protein